MAAETPPWPTGRALLDEIAQTRTPPGSLAFWHIGQSGFFVRGGDTSLLFDPYLTVSSRRAWPAPLAPDEITHVDYVFCTHDHSDHLDPFAVSGIAGAAPKTQFLVAPAARDKMLSLGVSADRLLTPAVDEAVQVGAITVHAVPASHGDSAKPIAEAVWEPDPQRGYRYVGFVVDLNGVRFYHAGDTTIYPGMVERLQPLDIDIALIPINGRDWFREQRQIIGNCDHREAADLGNVIGAGTIVPMHYDMFAGNPGSPAAFVEYCSSAYPGQDFHIPVRCRRWVYVK
jgi:L-ascorbate 6-phosphate lactonase